jgi:hypothetical protein
VPRKSKTRAAKLKHKGRTYRSLFEVTLAKQLYAAKRKFKYEDKSYAYFDLMVGGACRDCGSSDVGKLRSYTPDFFLNNGVIIEAKGKLDAKQRKKLIDVRIANPSLDLRLVFMRDNKIHRLSKTRYSTWATKHGFLHSIKTIPKGWL